MAAGFWDCYFDLGKKLQHVEGIRHVPRQEKKTVTVAVYQGSTDPEGDVTRIASDLCRLWASAADAEGNKGSIIFSVWPGTQTPAFSDLKIA